MNPTHRKVIETLRAHMADTQMIWHNPCLIRPQSNGLTGKSYNGINQFVTAMVSGMRGYNSPYWATFRQIKDADATLNDAKGQGVPIIFYRPLPDREDSDQPRCAVKHSHVFNLDLVTGLEPKVLESGAVGQATCDLRAENVALAYTQREGIRISHGSPAYVPSTDTVHMPSFHEVTSTDEYYACYFHELAHSTGHHNRLGRFEADSQAFKSKEDYSKEELVAEITAALLCHECGVASDASIKNSAAYLQGWTRYITDNESAFVTAIQLAYKAHQYICSELVLAS